MLKLGFGTMRLPLLDKNNPKSIDINQAKKMVDMFIERGYTYFDTAWMYHDFQSEKAVKTILTERYPRESYTIATKLHAGFFETKEDIENIFNTQLENIGVEYFDYYLLHDMNTDYYEKYEKFDCFNWLLQKKESGQVRNIGFSFHEGPELLERILSEHPEIDFVQLQLNYLDWESKGIRSRECYEVARSHNTPIVVMEPVKGGLLAMLPTKAQEILNAMHPDWSNAQWAIKYIASLDGIMMILSGMSSLEQMDDNTNFMKNFEKLTDEEKEALLQCVDIINSDIKIACTGCSYCTDGCAKQIPIPAYFSLYNAEQKELNKDEWTSPKGYYEHISSHNSKASECIGCGQCELICPQHLPVIKYLKEVADYFEVGE